MKLVHQSIIPSLAAGFLLAALTGGCNDPRYRERQAQRWDNIDTIIAGYQHREEARPEKIEGLFAEAQTLEERRKATLSRMAEAAINIPRKDAREWKADTAQRREIFVILLGSKTGQIPEIWADLAY